MNIEEILSIANDEQKPLLLDAVKEFEAEASELPGTGGESLNNSINTQYRNLALKYQKIFAKIME